MFFNGCDRENIAMYVMPEEQWKAFILHGTRTGKLATVKDNGDPHVVPIWFVFDHDAIIFSSGKKTMKTRNIEAHGRATLCVDSETYPYAFVTLECDAKVEHLSPQALVPYTTKIAERYVDTLRAKEFGQRNAAASEVLIRLTPTKVIPWGGMSE